MAEMVPLPFKKLLGRMLEEWERKKSLFEIPHYLFFDPWQNLNLQGERFGQKLETPLGVAAGPHTQLCSGLIASWLCGARYLELKTVQTLDQLQIPRPCIDMADEGHNCEWSQELRLEDSFKEYLHSWIVLHILRHHLGYPQEGTIFNMSVGYNMEGILRENVQTFFSRMRNATPFIEQAVREVEALYPEVTSLQIPSCLSDNITLSTMHGCPPEEIEKIALYLIREKRLHTTVKLNPTLNGPRLARKILNEKLGFEVTIPDIAFEHDLKYPQAVKLIKRLQKAAQAEGVGLSFKLTNTLENTNTGKVFPPGVDVRYMSGRPLHALAVTLAHSLQEEFGGELDISLSAGVDCFNVWETLSCGLYPLTICSDLLKPGGPGRLPQYVEQLRNQMAENALTVAEMQKNMTGKEKIERLRNYKKKILKDPRYHKSAHPWKLIKGQRSLHFFDCVTAPCEEACPTHQNIPSYIHLASLGKFKKALEVIRYSNPFPNSTGLACDHTCQERCTRLNYDEPLRIREIKRYLALKEKRLAKLSPANPLSKKVAIVGGGPSGLSAAFYLRQLGFSVEIFEEREMGGMITQVLPPFRTLAERVSVDIKRIQELGFVVHQQKITNAQEILGLSRQYDYVYLSTGAMRSKKLVIPGEDFSGVVDFLTFLRQVKSGELKELPGRVGVIGGGNSAMDAARSAQRLIPPGAKVTLLYRRTVQQMPADREEIEALQDEGIEIMELVAPQKIIGPQKLEKLVCQRQQLNDKKSPVPITGAEVEIPLDYLVVAIGQDKEAGLVPEGHGYWENKFSGNIFVGGDLYHGPKSIIQAIADGKETAWAIGKRENCELPPIKIPPKNMNWDEIRKKRYLRTIPVKIPQIPLSRRKNFEVVIKTLPTAKLKEECSRCLWCDELCDICVTVCPNRANVSYRVDPKQYQVQTVEVVKGQARPVGHSLALKQSPQVYNWGDCCNECGNCASFCPTNGRPYQDKPKVFLTEEGFHTYLKEGNSSAFYAEEVTKTLKARLDNSDYVVSMNPQNREQLLVEKSGTTIILERLGGKFIGLSNSGRDQDKVLLEGAHILSLLTIFNEIFSAHSYTEI
jgi:putative selenate reductase